jgi:hypothetical protein
MDKGQLLIHHADGVHLRGNTLRDGLSDGAFLRFDQHGVIEDNQFQRMKMGGLLINESSDMMVRNNVFHSDGSRNITIEWGSQRIDVLNNTVEGAGREGLWGWGYASGRVEGNTFTENGRKHDSSTSTELQLSPWKTGPAELYHSAVVVANNTFQAGMDEVSAISVPVGVDSIVIRDNKFAGPNRTIRTDWLYNGFGHVTVQHNEGWRTEESGHYSEPSTGDRTISFPHHLDILDPNNAEVVSNLHFTVSLKPLDPEALGPFAAIADARKVIVTFDAAPRKGSRIEFDWKVSAE